MRVQYISDMHLERKANRDFLAKNPIQPQADYLFLMGDIVPLQSIDQIAFFVDHISNVFSQVFWLPGNHEFYGSDYFQYESCNICIRKNVHLINNQFVVLEDQEVIFSTLWSMLDINKRWDLQYHINDFKYIQYKRDYIDVLDYNKFHMSAKSFVVSRLNDTMTENKVVITHHCPIQLSQLKNDNLQSAYCSRFEDLIQKYQPNFWFYGHTHTSDDVIRINQTKLITNQYLYGNKNTINQTKCIDL